MSKIVVPRWVWALTGSGHFACGTAPGLETRALEGMVKVFARRRSELAAT